jgi:endoglucanase
MHIAITSHNRARTGQRALLGMFVLAALLLALVTPSAWAQGTGYWHTSGNKILDSGGTEVRIAGVNWYGAETPDYLVHGLWAQDYHTVLNTIKSLGYNVIRIPFSNQLVESNPVPTNFTTFANGATANQALDGQTALQDMDTIISYAGSIGLRVILDNHRSEAGETNEANGLWYTSAYPQANWIADWKTMATRYSASQFTFNGNPTVIGMDLRNEPHLSGTGATTGSCWTGDTATNGCPTSLTTQNWPVAAEAAGNAILAVNPKLLIIVEGNDCYSGVCGWQGGNLIGVASNPVTLSVANQLVYSAHDYGPNLFQQAWFSGNTTSASLDAVWNKYWGYISVNDTAPVWLGEFGTDNTSTDVESTTAGSQGQWFQSLVGYLQNNSSINWTYWALNGEDTYDLLDNNYDATPPSSLKQSLLASIQFPLGATPSPSFTISSSPSSLTIAQGGSGTDTISVADAGGFTGGVTLAATGLPSGVIAAFAPNPATGTSIVTFTASASAPQGSTVVTITGTSGALTPATATIALTIGVASMPTITSFAASPATITSGASSSLTGVFTGGTGVITPGNISATSGTAVSVSPTATTTYTLTVTPTTGAAVTRTATVTVTSSGPIITSFVASPATIAAGASSNLTGVFAGGTGVITPGNISATSGTAVSVSPTATTTYTLTVTPATGAAVTQMTTVTVTPKTFTLGAAPASLTVNQGATNTSTVTVTDVGGFTGSVTLASSSLPSGVTATFASNPTTGSSMVTFTAGSTAVLGTSTVTITGTSGTLTATTPIALTVGTGTGGFACHIGYTISSQWQGGFGAAITINNTGTTAISNWTLTWTFANGQTITQLWNGTETQSGANVTVTNLSYNGSIPAGGSYTGMGFNGSWNSTNAVPASFAVNGTICK